MISTVCITLDTENEFQARTLNQLLEEYYPLWEDFDFWEEQGICIEKFSTSFSSDWKLIILFSGQADLLELRESVEEVMELFDECVYNEKNVEFDFPDYKIENQSCNCNPMLSNDLARTMNMS